jgi:hypothetical protein
VVKAGDVVEGRDGAAEVGRDAGVGVADEEGEVKLREERRGDDGRIVGFGVGGEGVRGLRLVVFFAADVGLAVGFFVPVREAVHVAVGKTVRVAIGEAIGANTFLLSAERGGNGWWFAIWRHEVVNDILDEDSLALLSDEYVSVLERAKSERRGKCSASAAQQPQNCDKQMFVGVKQPG